MPFSRAWRVSTPSPAPNAWEYRLIGRPAVRLDRGDTLLARLWMRAAPLSATPVYARFVMERVGEPYTKSVEWHISAGRDWQLFEIPFLSAETYESRDYTFQIWVPHGPQEIEIGGLTVSKAGRDVSFSQLGITNYPYSGIEPDAEWRKQANTRIERIRKGDIVVVVRDGNGTPVSNAAVRVTMRRHAFGFGTAVDAATLNLVGPDGDKYRAAVKSSFNKAVLENDLKWPEWERDRQRALSALRWLNNERIGPVRGHALVWPGWQYLPPDLPFNQGSPDGLRGRVNRHISDIVGAVKGRVAEWDVVNEPVLNRALQAILGEAELAEWFRVARSGDAEAKLYINEHSIITGGGHDFPHQNAYANIIQTLQSRGAPLDGVGIQAHFDTNLTPPARVVEILDRFSSFGKALQITELSINTPDEAAQAAYLRDFLTAAFSHPAVTGVLTWGFWEGRHFAPAAAMIRKDWTPKPAAEVWTSLVRKLWWTEDTGRTNSDGVYRTRGFAGDYDIEVEYEGRKLAYEMAVSPATGNYLHIGPVSPGTVTPGAVANAASYARGAIAPGQIATIWGEGFGGDRLVIADTSEGHLPTLLADTGVTFDGIPAAVLYAAPGQVSVVVPYNITGITTLQVSWRGVQTNPVRLPVADAAPGLFTSTDGRAVAVNSPSGELNSPAQPATRGSALSLYLTGAGLVAPVPAVGAMIRSPDYPTPVQSVSVSFGSTQARVLWSGLISPGVLQVNAEVPATAAAGPAVPVSVRVGNAETQKPVTVAIR